MGSAGTGSAGTGRVDAGRVDAGRVDAGSANAGRERLARYSLTGPENQAAVNAGLAGGAWFRSAVPRKDMKALMQRDDQPAIRDTAIWLGLFLVFGRRGAIGRLAELVGGAVPVRLRRTLWLLLRLALARMRAWHRLQDPLDEQCGL